MPMERPKVTEEPTAGAFTNSSSSKVRTLPTRADGGGELVFARVGHNTVLERARATSPLRFLTPRSGIHAAWVFVTNLGGGLVDGDKIALRVGVRAGATALLTTQASTKIYRSNDGCSQETRASIEDDGLLAILSDPVVCFAEAKYTQRAHVSLSSRASFLWVDTLLGGRIARGERWNFHRYQAELKVLRGDEIALVDAFRIDAALMDIQKLMGRFNALATLVAFGPRVAALRERVLSHKGQKVERAALVESIVPLKDDGVLVRIAGESDEIVSNRLRAHLVGISSELGDDPFRRKW